MLARTVRDSRIHWLGGATPAQRAYLDHAELIRLEMNRRLFLGLFEFEAQYGIYPPGGFYARHVDSFARTRSRLVSSVLFLNRGWRNADGGVLVLYDRTGPREAARVVPEAGTLVLMLSEDIPHEVEITHRRRLSIAGWYRINTSTPHRPDPAR